MDSRMTQLADRYSANVSTDSTDCKCVNVRIVHIIDYGASDYINSEKCAETIKQIMQNTALSGDSVFK
jgi:hypothetical protein